jgi:hypothetical protein
LIDNQIKTWRPVIAQYPAYQCVSLPAMMGLMIEEMIERRGENLFDVLRIDEGSVSDGF